MMAAGDDAWPTRPLQGELSAGHAQVQVSQGGCPRRPSRCGQARLSSERDLAPSGLLAQASRVSAWHLVSQSGCWLHRQHRTHACGGCPAAGGGPGTSLQRTPHRLCCASQPCVQPRPRLRPTALSPAGATMLGTCLLVPCLPKTGAPGAGLGAHLCPQGKDSIQHELARHTATEGRKKRRDGGKEEAGKGGGGGRGNKAGRAGLPGAGARPGPSAGNPGEYALWNLGRLEPHGPTTPTAAY